MLLYAEILPVNRIQSSKINKGADQPVPMRMPISAFVFCMQQSPVFLRQGQNYMLLYGEILPVNRIHIVKSQNRLPKCTVN